MKYCSKCGKEVDDNVAYCPNCGNKFIDAEFEANNASPYQNTATAHTVKDTSTYDTLIKVFMVLSCCTIGWFVISLCWLIPMTIYAFKCANNHEKYGTTFAVLSLLFCNTIAGILMLVRDGEINN